MKARPLRIFALLIVAAFATRLPSLLEPNALQAQTKLPPVIESGGYVKPEACATCHRSIWETYRRTGMGRSFSTPAENNTTEDYTGQNTFYHQPSDSYFTMLHRDGKYYQRRHQIDFTGKQVNVMEKQIDYIMGSGNHARTYLHRTDAGTLVELPLGWYAEKGGYWAMNPGYDRPDHEGFRRPITYDCMFCHNGYPQIPAGHDKPFAEPVYTGQMPQGIDCQRCHGPGLKHIQTAQTAGAKAQEIRAAIVNPSRLSTPRQLEVCMACHLETTSFPLPNALQRYERGPFSYKPGEPLGSFILNFDHAAATRREDKFEIVSAAYRLRRSACFLKSGGKLLCTSCHNPHDIPRGKEAVQYYTAACRQCHGSAFNQVVEFGKHTRAENCVECHMPKRRTEDVVHVAVTDHYIQRYKPAADLLAERPERHETNDNAYRGPVALYYPEELPHMPENDLYLAIAQVNQRSNLKIGIAQLTAAIERDHPKRAEYYFELAEARRDNGQLAEAVASYRQATLLDPNLVIALQHLGSVLRRTGQYPESLTILKRATSVAPANASTWQELGLTYQALGKGPDAIAALKQAIALDPDMSEAHNNLGIIQLAEGAQIPAADDFREAIRIQPDYADAHANLGNLLSGSGDPKEALYHFEIALRLRPKDALTRYNYALALGRERRFDEAQQALDASLAVDPGFAEAHELLGDLLMAKDQVQAALPHYREAVRIQPEFGRAQLRLGSALAGMGDVTGAIPHLQKAASDADPAVRSEAAQLLGQFTKGK